MGKFRWKNRQQLQVILLHGIPVNNLTISDDVDINIVFWSFSISRHY